MFCFRFYFVALSSKQLPGRPISTLEKLAKINPWFFGPGGMVHILSPGRAPRPPAYRPDQALKLLRPQGRQRERPSKCLLPGKSRQRRLVEEGGRGPALQRLPLRWETAESSRDSAPGACGEALPALRWRFLEPPPNWTGCIHIPVCRPALGRIHCGLASISLVPQ